MRNYQNNRLICILLIVLSQVVFWRCDILGDVTAPELIDRMVEMAGTFGGGLSARGYIFVYGMVPVLVSLLLLLALRPGFRIRTRRGLFAVSGILAALSALAAAVSMFGADMGPTVFYYLTLLVLLAVAVIALREGFAPLGEKEKSVCGLENKEHYPHGGKTFPLGGIHPAANKLSAGSPIEKFPLPDDVVVPLSQHIGAPAVAKVAKGDKVLAGQLIAEAGGFVSANIHAPVSGTVTAVDLAVNTQGIRQPMITIKREGDEWAEGIDTSDSLVRECSLSPQEIIAKIKEAGIVGMGGATFPTHVKLSVPQGKKAEFLIINGVECEPYLTADHRVMLERGEELLVGVSILAKALNVNTAYIGIENNKPDAIAHLTALCAAYPGISVVPLKVQYPQGGEKQLIAAVTGRQVPSGGLPIDVGAVVQNVGTALAVYEAVQKNKPLVERVVTVTGKTLAKPSNLLVRVGTPVQALIDHCGGLPGDAGKVIGGGPMMGRAMSNLAAPVTKGSSGVLVMPDDESLRAEAQVCIKCAKCVDVCPMGLEPFMLNKLGSKRMFAEMEPNRVTDCIECGSCSYTCPAALPLLDNIRVGKAEVMKLIRARKA